MIAPPLVAAIRKRFALDWHGIHGASHWARVRHIGLRLAAQTGASRAVVEYFAFLHDACRRSDGHDPQHGSRAALFAERINARLLRLDEQSLAVLVEACIGHSDGDSHQDPTVATCWDADRLDLGRLGITPDPNGLCTDQAAKDDFYRWATGFSKRHAA
ncbi:hypothetical protein [Ideonella sp. A 288]|uniref:hypothetical protein n=1 Tax=Ideonella sp. A 288 TaxID=1962181 RepID=UPI000B4B2465|nr:hypothetical protein [Ideonella sp. A 288]